MSVTSSPGVLSKAIIATLGGVLIGALAGVWSLRQPATKTTVSASPAAAPAVKDVTTKQVAVTTEPVRALASTTPPSPDGDAHVLERARTLARRPDVTALIALRDDVVRRATERGIAGSSSIKTQLDEIDVRLNEARLLQLKLDAEELRKSDPRPAR